MATKGQETAQRLVAILVIMAMLSVMGIPLTVIAFFATVVYFVWRAVQRSEQQDVKNIFDFYIAANEILRDDEKRWFGFEIDSVIKDGEQVLHLMSDPPPLVYYALGALYQRAGDTEAAAEHLAYLLEGEHGDESRRATYSPELKRYVQVLRRIEREPTEAPVTMSAIRSLERMRRSRAEQLLADARARVGAVATRPALADAGTHASREFSGGLSPVSGARAGQGQGHAPPPPIADVLRDVYEEEKKTA
ncbi:MAG TPA: hypothetical protein VFX96_09430 [Pyrinomonadaceae bacterium]|nr:hypothetical protein [Pyrinomonadaceae bacterium]